MVSGFLGGLFGLLRSWLVCCEGLVLGPLGGFRPVVWLEFAAGLVFGCVWGSGWPDE